MSPFELLFEFVRQNLLPTLFIVFIGISILRRALKQASQDQARRKERASLPRPGSDDDLREQVRRGFEEMMRQRTAAAAARSAPKAPVKPAPKAAPKVALRPEPAAAPRAVRP